MAIYHPCGAINVIDADGDGLTGIYHPSGAVRVIIDSEATGRYDPSGALLVTTGVVRPFSGAQPVAFVDGSTYTGFISKAGIWNVFDTTPEE